MRRVFKPRGKRARREQDLPWLRQLRERERQKRVQPVLRQKVFQNLPAPLAAAQDDRAILVGRVIFQVRRRRLQTAAVARQLSGRERQELFGRQALGIPGREEAVAVDDRPAAQLRGQILDRAVIIAASIAKRRLPEWMDSSISMIISILIRFLW